MKPHFVFLVLAALPAFADEGTKPAPAPQPDAAAPEKKERKTTPEADATLAKYASQLQFPNDQYKAVNVTASTSGIPNMGEIRMGIEAGVDTGVACTVSLSDEVKAAMGPDQTEMFEKMLTKQFGDAFQPFLLPMPVTAKSYDLSHQIKDGKTSVTMKKFAPKAQWETATLHFDANGLLERMTSSPNVDPNDPMGAMYAGQEIEAKMSHVRSGDRYLLDGATVTDPFQGEIGMKVEYFDLPGAPRIPKSLTITTMMLPEPIVVVFQDWAIDAKPVAGTEKKAETPKPVPTTPDTPK